MAYNNSYEIQDSEIIDKRLRYFFLSKGEKEIIKAIEYSPIADTGNYTIFNFGFGDYDAVSGLISDKTDSNNGDMFKVFYTVLNTVTDFFENYPKDALLVNGSDSAENYMLECIETCTKKCTDICKNANRRIKTYRNFINKNFEELRKNYIFYGSFKGTNTFVPYENGKEYDALMVFKKR
jgi:hypothetical protein